MAKTDTPKKPRPKPKPTDKEQSERFIETARELGVDEWRTLRIIIQEDCLSERFS